MTSSVQGSVGTWRFYLKVKDAMKLAGEFPVDIRLYSPHELVSMLRSLRLVGLRSLRVALDEGSLHSREPGLLPWSRRPSERRRSFCASAHPLDLILPPERGGPVLAGLLIDERHGPAAPRELRTRPSVVLPDPPFQVDRAAGVEFAGPAPYHVDLPGTSHPRR